MFRLKIYEQLLVVYFIAVLIPIIAAALLITNINQQSLRELLTLSAINTASSVRSQIEENLSGKKLSLFYLKDSLNFIKNKTQRETFLHEVDKKHHGLRVITLEKLKNNEVIKPFEVKNDNVILKEKNSKNSVLIHSIKLKELKKEILKNLSGEPRQIFIIDQKQKVLFSNSKNIESFNQIKKELPIKSITNTPIVFGTIKNQPHVFIKLTKPEWNIVVLTPKNITKYSIKKARSKILIALAVTAISILVMVVLYALALRTNIRQLFKGIIAISKGNYKRRIRLIDRFLTPYEVIFLANEFNSMAEQVDSSYIAIQEVNLKLSKLDEMKSNLIDTVSHEFRTPLTCIKGYTTRLLRNTPDIDEETKRQSLKVIRDQTKRLSRMVEDLLVIPDIESSLLRVYPDNIELEEFIDRCIEYIKHKQQKEIIVNNNELSLVIFADPDRTEQIFINLFDNAIKYSEDNSAINVNINKDNEFAIIEVINYCKPIALENLENLFDKFSRVEESLTRTTRGTGLGLYIAKGIVEAMNGQITLSSENNIFKVTLKLPLAN